MTARTYLYTRVSTEEQTTENQRLLAEQAGYRIEPKRVHAEVISGTVPAMERPMFAKLVDKLEEGDTLVVAKLDRLGRNASDIDRTVEILRGMGVRVVVLDLPVMEVTSAAGDLVRRMFAAFAQFERDQLVERTHAGLARAKSEGKVLGRKRGLAKYAEEHGRALQDVVAEVQARKAAGESLRELGKVYGVSGQTILREIQPAD